MENLPTTETPINFKENLSKFYLLFKTRKFKIWGGVFLAGLFYVLFLSSPFGFKAGTVVSIEKGSSLHAVSVKLKEQKVIRSTTIFKVFVVLYGGDKHLIPTNYIFPNRLPVFEVARRITKGEHGFGLAKITIPEGWSNKEIADKVALELPYFNKEQFLLKAKDKEGYLFPDTYFFTRDDAEEDVILSMVENYKKKILEIQPQIASSGKNENNIITMASIIEKEAKGDEDRGFISGILWKRLEIGMALQADAAPITYEVRGLPKGPIGNPGLKAIKASINPIQSNYLYYLHDKDGKIHYARNFEEHKANIATYLR